MAEERRNALSLDYLERIVQVINYSFIVFIVISLRVIVVALIVDIAHSLRSVAGDDERRSAVRQTRSIRQSYDLIIIDHVDVFLLYFGIGTCVLGFKLEIHIDERFDQPKYGEVARALELPTQEGDNSLHFLIKVALFGQYTQMLFYTFPVLLQELTLPDPFKKLHEAIHLYSSPFGLWIQDPKLRSALFFHIFVFIYTNLILAEMRAWGYIILIWIIF